jgi:tryptophan synthase alpha chain
MSGLSAIENLFSQEAGRAKFMPYFPLGYPDLPTSIDILEGLAKAGADALELGVPFSDPLADGPVIQQATQIALQNGTTLADCLAAAGELRRRGVTIPLMLMSYVNPLLSYGGGDLEQLFRDLDTTRINGLIIPDLPPDEAADFQALADSFKLAFAHFLAPTSSPQRLALAAEWARGFIYLVSVAGVTGAREEAAVSDELRAFIGRVRAATDKPLVVGFGISSPEKAQAVGQLADGLIIGSKLISLAKENPQAALEFAASIVGSLRAK